MKGKLDERASMSLISAAQIAGIVVLASHDPSTLKLYCNKVMRLHHGAMSPICEIARLDELLAA